jgi:type IV pilus assembly protein PilN
MRQPQNAAILTQSDFLNSLFQRKAFSWTATMTDLETVLPAGVQVLSIEPEVAKDGQVTIRLRVSGARDKAVDLVRNLEKSRHFAAPRLAGEALAQANSGPNAAAEPISNALAVNFDILADYRPLGETEESAEKTSKEPGAQKKTDEQDTGAKKKVSAPQMSASTPHVAAPAPHAPKKRGGQ